MSPLACEALGITAGARVLVQDLSFALEPGEFLAILGRNGCGKTLTLHALAGLSKPCSGRVLLDGLEIGQLPRRRVAQRLGLLPQDREESLAMTALESVLVGRHPHLGLWQRESADDLAIANDALARLGLAGQAGRLVPTLSGGEQRRVAMAGLLAQFPRIYLLDEPSNHLDPLHQIQVMSLFRDLAAQGASVIATLHDPTLADRFADRVLLLYGDGRHLIGPARDMLNESALSELYLTPMRALGNAPHRAFIPA